MRTVTLSSTAELPASIPALIGYTPDDVLLVMPITSHTDEALTLGDPISTCPLADAVADTDTTALQSVAPLIGQPIEQLLLVVVPATTARADHGPSRADLLALAQSFRDLGLADVDLVTVSGFTEGAHWCALSDPQHPGHLPDPATTPLALMAAAEGEPAPVSRDALRRRFTPVAPDQRDRLADLVTAALDDFTDDILTANTPALLDRLRRGDAAIRAAATGQLPGTDHELADLIATFADPHLQMLMVCPDTYADTVAAETLALHLWCHATEPRASHLAGYLAALAYQRGATVQVRIALDAATEPTTLAAVLAAAVIREVHPATVRAAFVTIARCARDNLTSRVPLA